jgi:hypothetical protein
MKHAGPNALLGSLLLLVSTWPSVGQAAAARGGNSASYQVKFGNDDVRAQRIARKLLRRRLPKRKKCHLEPVNY